MKNLKINTKILPSTKEDGCKLLMSSKATDKWAIEMGHEEYEELLKDEDVRRRTEEYQKTGNAELKRSQKGVFFLGIPSDESKLAAQQAAANNNGVLRYRHRMSDLVTSKRCYYDFDHEDPEEIYNKIIDTCAANNIKMEEFVCQISVTSSGQGIRMITMGRPGKSIVEDQQWFCELMGVKCDEVCKDISRNSFVTPWEYMLYYNPDLLFAATPDYEYNTQSSINAALTASKINEAKAISTASINNESCAEEVLAATAQSAEKSPIYNGIPVYPDYYEEWVKQNPYKGCREQTVFNLASDFYRITDGNTNFILQMLIKETRSWEGDHEFTEEECRRAVLSAVKNGIQTAISRRMSKVIAAVQAKANGTVDSLAPTDIPALPDKLPPILNTILSVTYKYQWPGLIPMAISWLPTRANGLIVKMPDGKKKPLTLQTILLGDSQCGKDTASILHKRLNADLIQQSEDSNIARLEWMAEQAKLEKKNRSKSPAFYFPDVFDNITGPMLRQLLYWHENIGEYGKPCMVFVPELDKLYYLNKDGQQCNLAELIKAAHDSEKLRSLRFTAESSSYSGTANMNITATGQPCRAKEIFKNNMVTDGTVGRIYFSSMFREEQVDYQIKEYTNAQRAKIKQYLNNIAAYEPEIDSDGNIKAIEVKEAKKLHREINEDISEHSKLYNDKAYIGYAYRNNEICYRMITMLYIANNCKWHNTFNDLYRWLFKYGMWNKMYYFGNTANDMLNKTISAPRKVKQHALALLNDSFTREELAAICIKEGIKGTPSQTVARWVNRNLVVVDDNNQDLWHKTEKGKRKI